MGTHYSTTPRWLTSRRSPQECPPPSPHGARGGRPDWRKSACQPSRSCRVGSSSRSLELLAARRASTLVFYEEIEPMALSLPGGFTTRFSEPGAARPRLSPVKALREVACTFI